MKLLHRMNKNSLLILWVSSVLAASTLVACGGGSGGGSGAPTAATPDSSGGGSTGATTGEAQLLAYELDGFKKCGEEYAKDITLTTKTHVAWGQIVGNKLVYLFNQEKGTVIKPTNVFFGSDPMPGFGNTVYCKPVAAGNNELAVFDASLAAIKEHINGKDAKNVLLPEQIQLHSNRLKQTMHALAKSEATILEAFDVITAYEKMRGGALFLNKETKLITVPKEGFQNEGYGDEGRDIDRAVLAIQQGIHDTMFTPANLARYKSVLSGKKFNSHEWYPGKVKNNVVADPTKSYGVRINASMDKNLDIRTAFAETTAFEKIFTRRPTGYYLAAGDVAKVTVPLSMVDQGFVIQVGASVHDKSRKSKIARPFRVVNQFPITSKVTEIANPNGGGIYIDVPYEAKAGKDVTIEIQNAIPAPFFSYIALKKMTNKEWQDVQRNNPAPWADFMSDKFMMTLPTSWIYKYEDPEALMKDWDERMDIVNRYTGHNINTRNNQTLYLTVDTDLNGDGGGIGYPTGNDTYNPQTATDGNHKAWFLVPGIEKFKDSKTAFHELGHAQLFENFGGEGEAAVNMLFVAVENQLYGKNIDQALGVSRGAEFLHVSRDLAAVNWMITESFRAGKPMAGFEMGYQHRGHAKYVDIAQLFGWKTIEAYYAQNNAVHRGEAVAAEIAWGLKGDDARILKWSIAAGKDLTPLIHFWGVQPSVAGAATLSSAISAAGLKPSLVVYNRLEEYQKLIPMDNASFKAHALTYLNVKSVAEIKAGSTDWGMGWYNVWLNTYGNAEGNNAQAAFNKVLATYFSAGVPGQ
jgi:Peptidase M60, enhancin and enhancin-like/N-terminal domain of M60-like peptidases